MRGQDPMVDEQIDLWPRRQGGQLLQELDGLKEQMGGPIAPGRLQLHQHAPVGPEPVHICGTTYPIYADLIAAGFSTISIDLDQQADPKLHVDQLKRLVELGSKKVVTIGNVDATSSSGPAKKRSRPRSSAARYSAFILSTSCEIPPRSSPDVVKWFMEAARDYGRYDWIFG